MIRTALVISFCIAWCTAFAFDLDTRFQRQGSWVDRYVEECPELLWLADKKVHKTEEGRASRSKSWSEAIFGERFVEFDRSLMSLYCMDLILDGSRQAYQSFTKEQPVSIRLTKDHFRQLHSMGKKLMKNHPKLGEEQVRRLFELTLILGDIGKSEAARAIFAPYGADSFDHDIFTVQALQVLKTHPALSPTLCMLAPGARKLLFRVARLAHYGHIAHLEGGPEVFAKLKESEVIRDGDEYALNFDFFVHICDVAGALGHVSNQSSLVLNERVYSTIEAMMEACRLLLDPEKTEDDAYQSYLTTRAEWLGFTENSKEEQVLTRIATWLRLHTPEEGAVVKTTVQALPQVDQDRIFMLFDPYGEKRPKCMVAYVPAVMVNLLNDPSLGEDRHQRISQAVARGAPFIAKVLEKQRETLAEGKADPKVPLNFNKVAGAVKEQAYHLPDAKFCIEKDGMVNLVL